MQTADSTTESTILSYFPERVQSALKVYAFELELSPDAVVWLAIGYFLESADISVDMSNQDSLSVPSKENMLALLSFPLQNGIEQYANEYDFPPEFVVEMAITFLLDPDASGFEDCHAGIQRNQIGLLQQVLSAK